MPITPDDPFPKTQGHAVRSKDWNDLVYEVQRLDTAKLKNSTDNFSGTLSISEALQVTGNIGAGVSGPQDRVDIANGGGLRLRSAGNDHMRIFGGPGGWGLNVTTTKVAGGALRIGELWGGLGLWAGDGGTAVNLVMAAPAGKGVYLGANGLNPQDAGTKTNLTINAAGNVGVGTNNALRKLHVEGGGQISLQQADSVANDSQAGLYWHSNNDYGIYRTPGPWTGNTFQQLKMDWPTGIILEPGTGDNAGYDKSYVEITGGKGLRVTQGFVGVNTANPTARVHVTAPGGFGGENADGTSQAGNVPLVVQSNGTVFGALNANGRQSFAMNIEGNNGQSNNRGLPVFYDKFDGNWRMSLALKNGQVAIGHTDPSHIFHVKAADAVGLFESTGGQAYLRVSAKDGIENRVEFCNRGGGRLALWVAGYGDALNVTRTGLVGIRTTTPFDAAALHVHGHIFMTVGASNANAGAWLPNANVPGNTVIFGGVWRNGLYFYWKDDQGSIWAARLNGTPSTNV